MAKKEREVVGIVKVTRCDPELGKVVDRLPVYAAENPDEVYAEVFAEYKAHNAPPRANEEVE